MVAHEPWVTPKSGDAVNAQSVVSGAPSFMQKSAVSTVLLSHVISGTKPSALQRRAPSPLTVVPDGSAIW